MSYQIVENTPDGFVVHTADNAETALSMWYAFDGEVSSIKDEHQETLSLTDLIALVAANKSGERASKSRLEVQENEDPEVDEGMEETGEYPIGRFPPRG
jgi:hypothetical protein